MRRPLFSGLPKPFKRKDGSACRNHHIYHHCLYSYFESTDFIGPICHHGGCCHGRKDCKRRIHRHMYRSVHWYHPLCPVCQGSLCSGSWNGPECVFYVHSCTGNGLHLWPGTGRCVYLRHFLYSDNSHRPAGSNHTFHTRCS